MRFHIKRCVLQWMTSIQKPSREELAFVESWATSDSDLRPHFRIVVASRPEWFGLLEAEGFFDKALKSVVRLKETYQNDALIISHLESIIDVSSDHLERIQVREKKKAT